MTVRRGKRQSEEPGPTRRASVPPAPLRDDSLNPDVNEILEIIADAQRAVDRELKSLSRKAKLTARSIYTLSLIHAGLNRSSLLVEYFDSLPSTMTAETDRLVAAGLIERKADPSDRRVIRLVLTRRGNTLRKQVMDRVNAMFIPRIGQIPDAELRQCVETLRKIVYAPPKE